MKYVKLFENWIKSSDISETELGNIMVDFAKGVRSGNTAPKTISAAGSKSGNSSSDYDTQLSDINFVAQKIEKEFDSEQLRIQNDFEVQVKRLNAPSFEKELFNGIRELRFNYKNAFEVFAGGWFQMAKDVMEKITRGEHSSLISSLTNNRKMGKKVSIDPSSEVALAEILATIFYMRVVSHNILKNSILDNLTMGKKGYIVSGYKGIIGRSEGEEYFNFDKLENFVKAAAQTNNLLSDSIIENYTRLVQLSRQGKGYLDSNSAELYSGVFVFSKQLFETIGMDIIYHFQK